MIFTDEGPCSANHQDRNDIFMNCTPNDYEFVPASSSRPAYDADLSKTRKAEAQRRIARERYNQLIEDVVIMEVKMGISIRWQPTDTAYLEAVKYIAERSYHRALENLQCLVIQRLFELNRLNLAGTGISRHNLFCTTSY